MRIAICDDNEYIVKNIAVKIENLIDRNNIYGLHFEYYCYTNPSQLLEHHNNECFDIAFIDIEMPEMDGFALADKLFDRNNSILILYITSYSQFIVPAIKHRVYRYIVKGDDSELEDSIKQMLHDLSVSHSHYHFSFKNKYYSIPYNNIYYFESNRNKVNIHTIGATYEQLITIKQLDSELSPIFRRCHSGYIVNITAIKSIESNYIVLKNDTQIPLSRKYKHDIIISFLDY